MASFCTTFFGLAGGLVFLLWLLLDVWAHRRRFAVFEMMWNFGAVNKFPRPENNS